MISLIIFDKNLKTPLYLQIYNQLEDQISSGKIQAGIILTQIKILTKTIHIGRDTIENAYQ